MAVSGNRTQLVQPELLAGERVVLMASERGVRRSFPATVSAVAGAQVDVEFERDAPCAGARLLALMAGLGPDQRVQVVRSAALAGVRARLTLDTRIHRIFERRSDPRFPGLYFCTLRGPGGEVVPARCVDISRSGVCIEAQQCDWRLFELTIIDIPGLSSLRCETVAVEPLLSIVVIHARFRALTVEADEALGALLEQARSEFTLVQEYLSGRIDDPATSSGA